MSYIRYGWDLKYVDAESDDYVYSNGEQIVDYGSISDNGIVEMLFKRWKTDDVMFKNHLLRRLADRLNVKLRESALTIAEEEELMEEKLKKVDERLKNDEKHL